MKKSIIMLIILNTLDAFLTYIGLKQGIIEEANVLLKSLKPELILILKIVLSGFLILILRKIKESKLIFLFSLLANLIYLYVMTLHIIWIYLSFK